MPADVNLASAGFFVLLRVVTRLSLGERLPTLFHLREQDVGSPRSHRHDRSEGARYTGRHLSPPPSALAKPVGGRPAQHTSQRRSATPFRHQRRECPLAREKPRKTGRKEQKAGSFRRKMRRKSRQTRGILQTECGIHSCAQADTRATIAQARKNGPLSSFRGRGRTDLYRDTAHDGGGFS